tara:strand:+ start:1568 stop:2338 length:771 start_codon:yes stop_codon:yes gene_type:complete
MKLLIKKIANSNLGIYLRNKFNLKPLIFNISKIKNSSVSDAFIWRTDNNFQTKFKYTDIFNIYYKIPNSVVEVIFYSKDNQFIKKLRIDKLNLSNELIIDKSFFNGLEDFGIFYIYHYTDQNLNDETIISNRCYLGYSKNNNLFSFMHGNTYASYKNVSGLDSKKNDIIQTSFLANQNYTIQKNFDNFDKSELIFTNPTSKNISINIGNMSYTLKKRCALMINIEKETIISFKSNCYFLRPVVFSYKNDFIDVHHS